MGVSVCSSVCGMQQFETVVRTKHIAMRAVRFYRIRVEPFVHLRPHSAYKSNNDKKYIVSDRQSNFFGYILWLNIHCV